MRMRIVLINGGNTLRSARQPLAPRPPAPSTSDAGASSVPVLGPMCDGTGSQPGVHGLWLDRLIEEGDPGDLISLLHRQQAWLELLRTRLGHS